MIDHSEESVSIDAISRWVSSVRTQVTRRIVGLEAEVDLLLSAVLCGRHVLIEGVPGLGKTLLLKTLATALGCSFRRIQFTPDLLPTDILGGYVFNPRDGSFYLRRGPIFGNFILADEINRAPAKCQSALLEVMEEKQVTIEGETHPVDQPFLVFATQNPIEHEGVYPLPQAQLDRFALRLIIEHPEPETEFKILAAYREPIATVEAAGDKRTLLSCRSATDATTVSDDILSLIVTLGNKLRQHPDVLLGTSPRMGVDLLHLARAHAVLCGRTYVTPDDIKALFPAAANHRLILTPHAEVGGMTAQEVVFEAMQSTQLV